MDITFLIGNGFDIGMGLKSSFKDFFPIYKIKSQRKEKIIKEFSNEINNDYDTWADFEAALGKYASRFTDEIKQDFIDQVEDFEHEFMNYLIAQEKELSYKENRKISEEMITFMRNFYSTDNLPNESSNAISKVFKSYNRESYNYHFVNYNYTFVLDKCLGTIKNNIVESLRDGTYEYQHRVGKVIHVHGSCNKDPIIGVNDASQIENASLANDADFCSYIIKPKLNQELRQGNDESAMEIINNSKIVCVYGMSLGITDKKWWNLLVTWLNDDQSRHLVLYVHVDRHRPITPYLRLSKKKEYMNKLAQYNDNSNIDINELDSRIHFAIHNNNVFHLDLTNDYNNYFRNRTI